MHSLAVVPIFMSAGAAILPTVVAACASVAAVVLKPRELIRLCRQRPGLMGGVGAGLAVVVGALTWYMMMPATPVKVAAKEKVTDWAKVAQDILSQEPLHRTTAVAAVGAAGSVQTAPVGQTSAVQPAPSQTAGAGGGAVAAAGNIVQDFTRAGFAGGASPAKLASAWSFRPDNTMFISVPAIAGKRIYVAGCQSDMGNYLGLLACVDAQTGKALWQVTDLHDDFLKPFFSSPTVTADGKYMLIGQGLHQDRDCELLCLDTATGESGVDGEVAVAH